MAKNPCPRSLCNNEKFRTTVFVCSYGTQVESFSKHKMVKNLVTLSLYGNKIHQKSAIFSTTVKMTNLGQTVCPDWQEDIRLSCGGYFYPPCRAFIHNPRRP